MFSNAAAIEKANQILVKQKLFIKEIEDFDVSTISTESTRAPLNNDSESEDADRRRKEEKIRNLWNLSHKMNESDAVSDNQEIANERNQKSWTKLEDDEDEFNSETTVSAESFVESASKLQLQQQQQQRPKENGTNRAQNNNPKSSLLSTNPSQAQMVTRQLSDRNLTPSTPASSHSNPNSNSMNFINVKNKKTKPTVKKQVKQPTQPKAVLQNVQDVSQNDFIFYKTQPDSGEEDIEPISIGNDSLKVDAQTSGKNVRFDIASKPNAPNLQLTSGNKVILNNFTNDHSKDYSSSDDEKDSNKKPNEPEEPVKLNAKFMREMFNHNNSSKIAFDRMNGVTMVTPLAKSRQRQLYAIDEQAQSGAYDPAQVDMSILNETSESFAQANDLLNQSRPECDDIIDEFDFSIFDLIDKTSKAFVFKPATIGLTMRAQIFRQAGLYPEYKFYIETLDGNLQLIMTARKKKKSKTPSYIINYLNYDPTSEQDYIETAVAKLKSNLLGTQFSVYDFGLKPAKTPTPNASWNSPNNKTLTDLQALDSARSAESSGQVELASSETIDAELLRKHYAFISYEMNVLGVKGPRQMQILLPGMDDQFNREDFRMRQSTDSLVSTWKSIEQRLKQTAASASKAAKSGEPKSGENAETPLDNQAAQIMPIEEASETSEIENQTAQPSGSKSAKSQMKSKLTALKKNLAKLSPKKKKPMMFNETTQNGQAPENGSSNRNVIKLINKAPEWNKQLRSFVLSFNNRVTLASVKNFQVVHESNTDYIVMQFGKVNRDLFTCDYAYPVCALQAFGIALSSIDDKLACD